MSAQVIPSVDELDKYDCYQAQKALTSIKNSEDYGSQSKDLALLQAQVLVDILKHVELLEERVRIYERRSRI